MRNSRINNYLLLFLLIFLAGCAQEEVREDKSDIEKPRVVLPAADKKKFDLSLKHIRAKRYKKAEKILRALADKYPDAGGPWANLGIIEVNRKNDKKAESYFLEALKRSPRLVQARNHLAVLYRKQGKFDEARQMLEAAIAADPYYQNAYYNLGILYEIYLQLPQKALENYKLYLDLKEDGDKQVEQWVGLLKRELKAGGK